MLRSGELRLREVTRDPLIADRVHERLDQYVRGVRIVGGDLTRQTAADGTISIFGITHDAAAIDTTPRLSADDARRAIAAAVSGDPSGAAPELVILPLSDGYHLAYYGQALVGVEILNVFVDAGSGALLRQYSEFLTEGVVGTGVGAYGDRKKVSVTPVGGTFVTDDSLRPAAITTYDMQGNLNRLLNILNRVTTVAASDIASDTDNDWTDRTVVDGHVYAGWYYDYLFKQFGRSGLDGRNLRMPVFVHPVRLQDIGSAPPSVIGLYYLNAFSCATCGPNGRGAIVIGEGAANGSYFRGIDVKPFSASLDVIAHELTHQVTSNTARLNGFAFSEAGALNEAFSDMFGTSTAFFYLPSGGGPMQASYLLGKDLSVPSGAFARSISNPAATNDPDHYTKRVIGGDPHFNSTIASHAFYLAIEGGTNRTSGATVQGVGASNREQIEKTFFRALTVLMPSGSTFALTRAATIQAARDLYGAGGTVERAVTQAWDAVGVQDRIAPTAAMLPNPASIAAPACTASLTPPTWVVGITVSAGASTLRMSQWALDFFDHTGKLQATEALSAAQFAQFFVSCGPGSASVLAQSDACTAICLNLDGDTSGSAQVTFSATDDAGRAVTFSTPRVVLQR
jgi:bacillolysin